ncbi:MAG: monovalent cation/H+ antiporter complex subunit F [Clostridia bacterium]
MGFLIVIVTCTGITSLRILLGPTVWDRLLAFNLVLNKVLMVIVLYAVVIDQSFILDIALTYALLGFISTLFIAKFIRDKGRI